MNTAATPLAELIRAIGLALNASHGTVTTDAPDAVPTDAGWRIDHTQELAMLDELARRVINTEPKASACPRPAPDASEWARIPQANSAALEALAAGQRLVDAQGNRLPGKRLEEGVPIRRGDESVA